ncbi:hypothetical protein ACFSQT_11765 [Mesorhizobium calcicola]|uniref:Uncharacterized protein n=1 Tax=Mesorhizobium calcicola TaxID=1300310 RepID=A0ABW4WAP8_9HYPH
MRKNIADKMLSGASLNYRKWLAQEAAALALTMEDFNDLDGISPSAILALAKIVAYGETDLARLAIACDLEPADLQTHLDGLCDFGFAVETVNGFSATASGEKVFVALGRNMIIRERFELNGRLEEIRILFRELHSDSEF